MSSPAGRFGIAAKRIASERALQQRVEEAIGQIRRSTGRGMVALNVEQIVTTTEEEHARRTVEALSVAAYETVESVGALGAIEGVFVLGAVLHRTSEGTPRLSYDFSLRMISSAEESSGAVSARWAALGDRVRRRVNGLFDEALEDGS